MRFAVLCLAPLLAATAGCVTTGFGAQGKIIRAKERVAPALVHIRPVKEVFRRGKRREVLIIGSGFIISPDGYVVTNEHVAGKSKYVRCVLSDKGEVEAEVVGADPYTDIAVLKLEERDEDYPYVRFGTSSTLKAGQMVLALGSPHGLARSVSYGIVSVTDRYLGRGSSSSVAPYNNWIQTDAAINPGNSGGPLVNLKGEVIGINTRKLNYADNVGFAIPVDIAREVIDQIIETGKVTRSMIGVKFQEMTRKSDDPDIKGVVISDVDPLSPAYRARIRPGDILLGINGTETTARFVEDLPAVRKAVADLPLRETATLRILRNGVETEVSVETEENGKLSGKEVELENWGCTVSELTPAVIRRAQLRSIEGVFISGIQVGGIAASASIRRGDIVLKVDDVRVENLESFQKLYDEVWESNQRLVLFTVKRGALTRFALLKRTAVEEEDEASETGDSDENE